MIDKLKFCKPVAASSDHATVESIIKGNDIERISETLVALSLNDPDWAWVERLCLEGTTHAHFAVRAISATCLGHLARIHGRLDLEQVLPRLEEMRTDPATVGFAETALEDIQQCMPNDLPSEP